CYDDIKEILFKNMDVILFDSAGFIVFNQVFMDSIFNFLLESEKESYYDDLIKNFSSKEKSCKELDKTIDSLCKARNIEFEKLTYKYFLFLENHKSISPNEIGVAKARLNSTFNKDNCIDDLKLLKGYLCDSCDICDTCEIIKSSLQNKAIMDKCIPDTIPPLSLPLEISFECDGNDESPIEISKTRIDEHTMVIDIYYIASESNVKCMESLGIYRSGYKDLEYDIPEPFEHYLNSVIDTIVKYKETLQYQIQVDIVGAADVAQISQNVVKYNGYVNYSNPKMNQNNYKVIIDYEDEKDYGKRASKAIRDDYDETIAFTKEVTTINDNYQLAFLRAFPIESIFNKKLRGASTQVFVIEYDRRGAEYRKVEVHIILSGIINMDNSPVRVNDWYEKVLYFNRNK
ncbi:MAG: hypothetical protein PHZ24_13485, partial [Bacteroidales bacterium]|nr:hypothetical protein [Bacteroidales bacterium]